MLTPTILFVRNKSIEAIPNGTDRSQTIKSCVFLKKHFQSSLKRQQRYVSVF